MKFTVVGTRCVYDKETGTTAFYMQVLLKNNFISFEHPDVARILKRFGFNPKGIITVRGYAHLKSPDAWDPEIGRKVAEAKCNRKLYTKMVMVNAELIALLEQYQRNTLFADVLKYTTALGTESEYSDSLNK